MTENPNDKTPEKPEIRYVPIEYLPHMHDDDDEIDLIELIRTIWNERTLIYKTVGVFIVIGLMVALGSREEYTSEIKLMPESQQGSSMGGLGGLARQFGVNTGTRETREGIPPSLYPDVTRSLVVMQRLMDYEVEVQGQEEPVTLYAYFREHQSSSTLATVKKYTIRLPFTILGGIRSLFRSETTSELSDLDRELAGEEETRRIIRMSREEWGVLRSLRGRVSAQMAQESGVVTVSVKMPDPVISAEVADQVVRLLSEHITSYRTEKARRDVEFIEKRHEEARSRFEQAQEELARFRDENRGELTALARTREQLLQSRYNLTFNLYNGMAERLEEARIKLQEETPVVSIMEPAAVPDQRSEPKRTRIMMIYIIFGVMLGTALVFGKPYWNDLRTKIAE